MNCTSEKRKSKEKDKTEQKIQIAYAKGFDIQYFNDCKKLIIKTPYPDAKEQFEYFLVPQENDSIKGVQITTPIKSIVATSTTHIPMLELLEAEDKLSGFQNTQYVSSEKN